MISHFNSKFKTLETVGELVDELSRLPKNMPVQCGLDNSIGTACKVSVQTDKLNNHFCSVGNERDDTSISVDDFQGVVYTDCGGLVLYTYDKNPVDTNKQD